MNFLNFFAELKRRNVIRVAGLYLVGAWLVVQVAGTVLPTFDVPSWVMRTLIILLALGLVPTLVFSWVFEVTPEGLKREEEVSPGHSVAPQTARRMDRTIIVVLVLALAYFAFDKFALAPRREITPTSLTTTEKPKLTEAEKLIQQAHALIDDPLAVRENYRLAEELGQRAVQLNPTDADAWAVLAQASLSLVFGRYDDTPARREAGGSQAERAIRLAPDSLEAGLAMAGHLLVSRQFSESESRARELLHRFPTDQRVVSTLVESLQAQDRKDEVRELLRQHSNTPRGLTDFLDWEAYDHYDKNQLVEADALLDQLFAGKPTATSYLTRLLTLWTGWGDLPAAAEFVGKIPSQLLLEDAFAYHAASVWLEMGETEKALETLRRIPREFLEEKRITRPKGLLAGRILQAAGRTAAAEVEWRQALTLVEKRLVAEPGRADWVLVKARLLAHLGEKVEGQKQFKLWREMSGIPAGVESSRSIEVQMALGNHEEVIQALQTVINSKKGRWLAALSRLRHDPLFAPIRSDARAQEMIATGEAWLKDLREAKARQASGAVSSASRLALAQLERAFELRDPDLPDIGNDPAFDSIRTDPRFRDLLMRLRLDTYFPETKKTADAKL